MGCLCPRVAASAFSEIEELNEAVGVGEKQEYWKVLALAREGWKWVALEMGEKMTEWALGDQTAGDDSWQVEEAAVAIDGWD